MDVSKYRVSLPPEYAGVALKMKRKAIIHSDAPCIDAGPPSHFLDAQGRMLDILKEEPQFLISESLNLAGKRMIFTGKSLRPL